MKLVIRIDLNLRHRLKLGFIERRPITLRKSIRLRRYFNRSIPKIIA